MFVSFGFLWICAVISVHAGKWGKWRDLTRCDGLPCECFEGHTEPCGKGKIIQMRNCDMSDGKSCRFNGTEGMLRKESCSNPCPGWSDPVIISCNCTSNEAILQKRCDNPPPVPGGVKCTIEGEKGGQAMTDEYFDDCNCTEEEWKQFNPTTPAPTSPPTTTQSTVPTTELLPCCNSSNSGGLVLSLKGTTLATTTLSYLEMEYLDTINYCRNCSDDEEDYFDDDNEAGDAEKAENDNAENVENNDAERDEDDDAENDMVEDVEDVVEKAENDDAENVEDNNAERDEDNDTEDDIVEDVEDVGAKKAEDDDAENVEDNDAERDEDYYAEDDYVDNVEDVDLK